MTPEGDDVLSRFSMRADASPKSALSDVAPMTRAVARCEWSAVSGES
ncbi:hypothetical protein Rhow_006747 [Rhodococcus wratislaviensis]|uniref:Uncharacterized protein n=1 Tax=Rhodococcus wratislaviensis TaxID=44752 RepID=A0A402CG64_RHOWR|nr:hypothetical protein Rhow_006747 [Rhodococcus wratislaviensis]